MELIICDQGSDLWHSHRIGSIGGSSITSVVAKARVKGSGMRVNLLYQLAGEILSGQKHESYSNHHMDRGNEQESDARHMYEFNTDNEVEQVGLVKENKHKHYSPDGLVNPDGVIEIKCQIPSVHVQSIITEKIDGKYLNQMQWGLHICQRQWCDFVSYSPLVVDRPIWIKRVERDDDLIKSLDDGANNFIEQMIAIVERIRDKE